MLYAANGGRALSIHMILSKSTIVELDMGELEEILGRVEAKQLQADDYQTIRELIESYVGLTLAVGDKSTTIRRLRQMLFGATTEKTATVIGATLARDEKQAVSPASFGVEAGATPVAEGDAKSALEPIVGAAAKNDGQSDSKTPAPGHGRNGADDYVGAEKIDVPHPSLSPGDPCPQCETEKLKGTGIIFPGGLVSSPARGFFSDGRAGGRCVPARVAGPLSRSSDRCRTAGRATPHGGLPPVPLRFEVR